MSELSGRFLQQLDNLPPEPLPEVNFFTAGGSGYLENPTSDLLALFMGGNASVPPWLLKALMTCLHIDSDPDELDITSLEVSREVRTAEGKFLDLLIYHQDFIIGIEHKTFSRINNPFESYQQHLESWIDNDQHVYTCILKPDANPCLPEEGWPFVNYSQLVSAARARMGSDQAAVPFSKWHLFYTEFLNHLYSLSGKEPTAIMNNEKQAFVTTHFRQLLKANALLEEFETAMVETAKRAMAEIFPDKTFKQRVQYWENDARLIHLYPSTWGNKTTFITLVYYPEDNSQQMKFDVYCTLNMQDCPALARLKEYVQENQSHADFLPAADKSTLEIVLDRGDKEMTIYYSTPNATLDENLQLLKEMALFVEGVLVEKTFHLAHSR